MKEDNPGRMTLHKRAPNSSSPSDHRSLSLTRHRVMSKSAKSKSDCGSSQTSALRLIRPILSLSYNQKQSVQSTWRHIKDHHGDQSMELILQKLVHNQPKIKDFFYQAAFLNIFKHTSETITTFRDHSRLLYRSMDQLIEKLHNRKLSDQILKEFREHGSKHAFLRKSGFKPDTWEKFGEAAVDIITGLDCVKSNSEAGKAWTILIASITDELRLGFEMEARRQSYGGERPRSACE